MRLLYIAIGFLCLAGISYTQSHDEEESVHFEGSANAPSDDEDIVEEGSGLPPDVHYATSPVMPKITTTPLATTTQEQPTTTHPRMTTTLVKQQKVSPYQTTTRISTRVPLNERKDEEGYGGFMQSGAIIGMMVVLVAIFIGIIIIICCCKKQKEYRPAKQMES